MNKGNFISKKGFWSCKNICFEAIQNINKSNRVLQAWIEVCHWIFAGWEVQTMWNLLKNMQYVCWSMFLSKYVYKEAEHGFVTASLIKKTINVEETYWLSGKEKVLGTAVSKEGHADSHLGHERTHHYWFLWDRCNYKQCFLLPTP